MANGKGTMDCLECEHSFFRREPLDSCAAPMMCSLWNAMIPHWRYRAENLFCSKFERKKHPGSPLRDFIPDMKEGKLYAACYNEISIPSTWIEVYDLQTKQFTDGQAKEVPPVIDKGITYSAPHFMFERTSSEWKKCSHAGGFVEARDAESNELLWNVEVYRPRYNTWKPSYVQDVFIVSLRVEDDRLIVETEKGVKYTIDLLSHKVKKAL